MCKEFGWLPYEYDEIKTKDIYVFQTLMNAEAFVQKIEERKAQAKSKVQQASMRGKK